MLVAHGIIFGRKPNIKASLPRQANSHPMIVLENPVPERERESGQSHNGDESRATFCSGREVRRHEHRSSRPASGHMAASSGADAV